MAAMARAAAARFAVAREARRFAIATRMMQSMTVGANSLWRLYALNHREASGDRHFSDARKSTWSVRFWPVSRASGGLGLEPSPVEM
jgi:hypothetical protein